MGQSSPSQLARILLSREAESKYPPPQKQTHKNSHTNRCGKNGEEIGSLLYYFYSNPISTTTPHPSLSIFSNPNANIQTPLYFPLPLSLSFYHTHAFAYPSALPTPLSPFPSKLYNSCFILFVSQPSLVPLYAFSRWTLKH
ncbi:hypothetical protein AAHA92_20867 [Salvia divinorum]|uniref:Uncharacterized protein n=1 Tax=Salvia divinorum TaxID=28513 RepID=A0ABD1GIL4_SALDI